MNRENSLGILKKARTLIRGVKSKKLITTVFTNSKDCCCVIGHFQRLSSETPSDYGSYNCNDHSTNNGLREASEFACRLMGLTQYGCPIDIASINNYKRDEYPQRTPKARSMAFLNDGIKSLEADLK